MKHRIFALILVITLALGLCACSGESSNRTTESVATKTFTDSCGRTVEVPEDITRVVASGQLAQIFVFSLAPEKMCAIASEWSEDAADYIDEKYYNLPEIGQMYGGSTDINVEELAKLAPQIVIDVGESKENMTEALDELTEQVGIPCVHIDAALSTMDEAYTMLGDLLGMEDEAEERAEYCREKYDRAIEIMEKVGEENKKTVLYCLGDIGCNVICKGTYHSEVIDLVSDNLAVADAPTSKGTGNEVSIEQINKWNPEYIFFAPDTMYEYVEGDPLWENLTAIKNKNYYEVPYEIYNWMGFPPSVQRYMGMMWMEQILYPEYCDYDMYEETLEFYELFFHCSITRAQYDAFMKNSTAK